LQITPNGFLLGCWFSPAGCWVPSLNPWCAFWGRLLHVEERRAGFNKKKECQENFLLKKLIFHAFLNIV
jgi:hypothetical protein